MHKRIGLIGLGFAAALVALVVACGGNEGEAGALCTLDSDCKSGELCHPDAKMCVQTCESGNDCPDSAKTCAAISSSDSRMICQCATDQLCAGANSNNICSTAFKICMPKCASDTDCPTGFACNTGSGQCAAGGGDAGVCGWDNCSTADWSSSSQGQACGTNGCGPGATCSGSGQSTCPANQYCSGSACGLPPRPQPGNTGSSVACNNFFSGAYSSGPVWNPTSDTGPVIFEVSKISSGQGTGTGSTAEEFGQCPTTATQFNVRVRAYRTDADWPSTRTGWATTGPALFYVNTSGTRRDMQASPTLLRPLTGYNPTGKTVEIQGYFCVEGTNVAAFQPGFVFGAAPGATGVRGNEACRQL